MANVSAKMLEGLKFNYAEAKDVERDGKKVKEYIPRTRPLTPEDVLSSREDGDETVVVTKDGRKYRLPNVKERKKE